MPPRKKAAPSKGRTRVKGKVGRRAKAPTDPPVDGAKEAVSPEAAEPNGEAPAEPTTDPTPDAERDVVNAMAATVAADAARDATAKDLANLEEIQGLNRTVLQNKARWISAKEVAADCKKRFESSQDALNRFIEDVDLGKPLPLFDQVEREADQEKMLAAGEVPETDAPPVSPDADVAPGPESDPEQIRDALALVEWPIEIEAIEAWPLEDRKEVLAWAVALHSSKADEAIDVPPRPVVLDDSSDALAWCPDCGARVPHCLCDEGSGAEANQGGPQ